MNDFEYDCYQKKKIASGARHKKASIKGPKGCTLPHEYLSKKEIQKMNGEVKTYNLKQPVSYEEFKNWPNHIKKEYLTGLQAEYKASDIAIGNMMGVSGNVIGSWRKICKIPSIGRGGRINKEKWTSFLYGKEEPLTVKYVPDSEELTIAKEEAELHTLTDVSRNKTEVAHASFELNANNWDDVLMLLRGIDISKGVRIGIYINSEEE